MTVSTCKRRSEVFSLPYFLGPNLYFLWSAPCYAIVKRRVQDFKAGKVTERRTVERSSTATTQKNIDKDHEFVIENRRISIDEIEEEPGISHGSIVVILHEHLHMNKVCARWIPKILAAEMKQNLVAISPVLLTKYNLDPHAFLFRLVNCDETWIYF
ncbi:uncharacterized protein LOC119571707 [Penaeus monodon]|uniref:uncharacterized protein LOC119571706 n=1 Tax=Penaeus monodon TaxID=6687 RepID=UPI0018A7C089|nr:uncharacterized protein LOC119571706 [Penaeus monodon]XP_037774820.1 uncharacterized protein LOC119571707 [Penaeus monodon]